MMSITSLRSRILVWLLPVLLTVLAISGVLSYVGSRYYTNQVFDRGLADSLNGLASRVMVRDGKVVFDFPEAAQKIFEWDLEDAVYYRVESRSRGHLAGQTDLELGAAAQVGRVTTSSSFKTWDGVYRQRRVRAVSKTLEFPALGDEIRVTVAETTLARERFSREVAFTVLFSQLLLIGLAILVVWRTLNRAITPVSDAAKQLEERTQHSEGPLDDSSIPDEIRPLTAALSSLLLRLQQALQIQRRFVADAAHQLRTPLTALRLHIDNALIQNRMEDARPMLQQVKIAADRSIRLSQQLLALAQSEEIILRGQKEAFDFSAMMAEIIKLWEPRAQRAGIDLRCEGFGRGEPIFLLSNPDLLTQVFDNLIDNGLRYCPSGSRVEIVRDASAISAGDAQQTGRLVVDVIDNGPGIAPQEREFVVRRFVRGDQTSSQQASQARGSGLGLAIASEIMSRLEGKLTLQDRPGEPGLRIRLEIPGLLETEVS